MDENDRQGAILFVHLTLLIDFGIVAVQFMLVMATMPTNPCPNVFKQVGELSSNPCNGSLLVAIQGCMELSTLFLAIGCDAQIWFRVRLRRQASMTAVAVDHPAASWANEIHAYRALYSSPRASSTSTAAAARWARDERPLAEISEAIKRIISSDPRRHVRVMILHVA